MCGRYVLKATLKQIQDTYGAIPDGLFEHKASYNVPPTSQMPVVIQLNANRVIKSYRWGLVPQWAKDPNPKYSMINARSETLAKKPSYRDAYKKRRCLVPADGFYEWKRTPDGKQPYYVTLQSGELMSFAALYEHWERDGQRIDSFTIITTPPNTEMEKLHDRMPAILLPEEFDAWLDSDNQDTGMLSDLLRPYPKDEVTFYPVSKAVNSPKNRGADLLEKAGLF